MVARAIPRKGRQRVFDGETRAFQVWLPAELVLRLRVAAVIRDRGIADLAAECLTRGLDQIDQEAAARGA